MNFYLFINRKSKIKCEAKVFKEFFSVIHNNIILQFYLSNLER